MFKYLRLHMSTSYFKTDIVLFPAPSTLVVWLWGIFQKSYQPVFACETPTICQREQVSRFFNWPIIVCVLLECLFLSVAMDCNLVPMDWNLVPMDCDLVPMDCDLVPIDCSCNCAIFPQLAGFQNTPSKSRPQLLRFCLPLGLWFALWIVKLRRLPCCLPWVVGLSIVCDVFAIYMIDKQLFQNSMT